MLGRQVARAIERAKGPLWSPEVVAAAGEGDLFIVNLECCISEHGQPWPDPNKPFVFRAPQAAAELLAGIGVGCVSLANNHALDYGADAVLETLAHRSAAGTAWVGAGLDMDSAQAPAVFERGGLRLGVVGFADHPAAFAAGPGRAGIAYADLRATGVGGWLADALTAARADANAVLVTPHW